MTVRSVDHGYDQLLRTLREARAVDLTVGVHAEEGAASKGEDTVAGIATINEFGLGVPARPAITGWFDAKSDAIAVLQEQLAKGLKAGRDPMQTLDRVAQAWAGEIQGDIASRKFKENAASTIKKKKSSTPLIDTGQFRSSIRGRVSTGRGR